jgi:hypothetical protein
LLFSVAFWRMDELSSRWHAAGVADPVIPVRNTTGFIALFAVVRVIRTLPNCAAGGCGGNLNSCACSASVSARIAAMRITPPVSLTALAVDRGEEPRGRDRVRSICPRTSCIEYFVVPAFTTKMSG